MLYNEFQSEIKNAMISKDAVKRDALKMALAKAQDIAKTNKCDLTDEIMIDGINKEIKQLNQTKTSLVGKEDCELYIATAKRIAILEAYLPTLMSEEEAYEKVKEILSSIENANKGKCMQAVMPALKGKADNKVISSCVDRFLKE